MPRVSLRLIDVMTGIQWNKPQLISLTSTFFSFSLGVEVLLHTAKPKAATGLMTPVAPATLIGDISYGDEALKLRAGVRNLTGAHLADFFPRGGTYDAGMEMLQHFFIETLDVCSEYDRGISPPVAGGHTPEVPNTQLLVLIISPPSMPSKRIIKVTVDHIGPFQGPLVGQDPSASVTKREFDALATITEKPTNSLFVQANKEEYSDTDIVIAPCSHFLVVVKNIQGISTAILNYVFVRPKPPQKSLWGGPSVHTSGSHQAEENLNKDPVKAPYNKALCPLTIEILGLQYNKDTNRLETISDATFLLGPIGLALLGFSFSCKLQSSSSSLALRHLMQFIRLLRDATAAGETSGNEIQRRRTNLQVQALDDYGCRRLRVRYPAQITPRRSPAR
ncbi:hypothetical protein ACHAPU_010145 [Fusarium lateritium]